MRQRFGQPYRAFFNTDPLKLRRFTTEGIGYGHVGAIHKGAVDEKPHRFPNEFIASHIGQFIGIPIPPFAITSFEKQDGADIKPQMLFSSIDFNYERESEPLPEPDVLVEKMPCECTGVLLFDILIANPDRGHNYWCDKPGDPTKIAIYDQDTALLGGEHEGVPRLSALKLKLGLCVWSINENNWHPFLRRLKSTDFLDHWYTRIYSIPDWFIEETCDRARQFDIDKNTALELSKFLIFRKRNLEEIVRPSRHEFAGIAEWTSRGLF